MNEGLIRFNCICIGIFAVLGCVSVAVGNILMGLATLGGIVYLFRSKEISLNQEYRGYYRAVIFFWCTIITAVLFSGDFVQGMGILAKYWLWHIICFFIITLTLDRYDFAKKFFLLSCIGMLLEIIYVIYQGLNGVVRAPGFQGNAMRVAGLLCMYTPIFLVLALDERVLKRGRLLAGVMFILSCLALLYNGTRGVWLADLFTCFLIMLYYICRNKRNLLYAGALLILIGGYALNSQQYVERFQSISDIQAYSASARLYVWRTSVDIFKEEPLAGIGLGNFKVRYMEVAEEKYQSLRHAHSNIFQIMLENGLLGLIGYLVLFGYIIQRNLRLLWHENCIYSALILAMTSGFFIQGLVDYNFAINIVVKYYWFLLGCFLVMQVKNKID